MPIKLLDDKLINKIAAGEVIERPASVVKELVENAIDAGSTRISVQISGGGMERIEVVDNGSGMAAGDVPLALLRHATSKIAEEADLQCINTMGFRGEALPSIASVCKMELYTQSGSSLGVRAVLSGGSMPQIETHPTAPGTKIIIRDIFYNTPARRKFLKSPVSEGIHIHDVMSKLALSRPDISFSFSNEKKLYFKTPGNDNLRDAAIAIYGREFANNFVDMEWCGENYALHGMVSKPEFRRVNRKNQTFFVNRRLVKSQILSRALDEAYRGLLLTREYPAVILFLTIDSEELDVNVHPQKTEVRFKDDKTIFRLLRQAIRDRLDKVSFSMGAGILNDRIDLYQQTGLVKSNPYTLPISRDSMQCLYETDLAFDRAGAEPEIRGIREWPSEAASANDEDCAIIGQCFESYILVQKGQTLWLVDQHAAHERILFSRLKGKETSLAASTQLLAFPQAFDISVAHMELLVNHSSILNEIGFNIEAIGSNAMVIRSAPVLLQGKEVEFINELIEVLEDQRPIDIWQEILAMMACKQAVKAGQSLSRLEMAGIINDLIQVDDYKNCPHGRPTIIEISRSDLDKRFKRK